MKRRILSILFTILAMVPLAFSDADGPLSDATKGWFPSNGYILDSTTYSRLSPTSSYALENLRVSRYVIGSASAGGRIGKSVAYVTTAVASKTLAATDLHFNLTPFNLKGADRLTVQMYGETADGTIFDSTTGTIPTVYAYGTPFVRTLGDDANLPSYIIGDATPIQLGISRFDTYGLAQVVLDVSAPAVYGSAVSATSYYPIPVTYTILMSVHEIADTGPR